jgi:hypothetical protein
MQVSQSSSSSDDGDIQYHRVPADDLERLAKTAGPTERARLLIQHCSQRSGSNPKRHIPHAVGKAHLIFCGIAASDSPEIDSTVFSSAYHRELADLRLTVLHLRGDYRKAIIQGSEEVASVAKKCDEIASDVFTKATAAQDSCGCCYLCTIF